MEPSSSSTSPIFGSFSQSTAVTSPSVAQNPFSSSKQVSSIGAVPQFGKPSSGTSSGFVPLGSNVFGSQTTSSSMSGGSSITKTTSSVVFDKNTHSQGLQGFQTSAAIQTSTFGGGAFPSRSLFVGTSIASTSNPSQNLFGKDAHYSSTSSKSLSVSPQGTETITSSHTFKAPNNPFGGGIIPTVSSPTLFSDVKASGSESFTSLSAPVRSNYLFGTNVSNSSLSKPTPIFTGGTTFPTSSSIKIGNSNPFGNVIPSTSPPLLVNSTKSNLSEAGSSVSTSTLLRKPAKGAVLFSASQKGPSPVFSSKPNTLTSSDANTSLFGKPGPQTFESLRKGGKDSSESQRSLFGKPVPEVFEPMGKDAKDHTESQKSLFGKPVPQTFESIRKGGKDSSESQKSLFGKPVAQTFEPMGKDGKGSSQSQKTLFGKPVPQDFESMGKDGKDSSESQKILFGKPVPQVFGSPEGIERESSALSEMKEKESQVELPFSSSHSTTSTSAAQKSQPSTVFPFQGETGSEKPKLSFSQSSAYHSQEEPTFKQSLRSEREKDDSSARQGLAAKTSVTGARLFGKALPITRGSSPIKGKEISAESDKHEKKSPGKSLSKWSNRESLSIKRKGRVPSLSHKPGAQSTFKLLRSTSSQKISKDQTAPKALTVKNIPDKYNNHEILRDHFAKFGTIKRCRLHQAKNTFTLTFDTPESALKAKREGHYIESGAEPLSMFFKASPQGKSEKESSMQNVGTSVADELQSMREVTDYEAEGDPSPKVSTGYKMRSEALQRARSLTPPPSTSKKLISDSRPRERRSPTPPPTASHSSDTKETVSLDSEVIKDLFKSLRNARAMTTTEKIAVLDTRDKLLKLLRGRQQASLASAKAFVGTCPDMCPEKERYYREDIRRLALYEVIPSTMSNETGLKTKVDHTKAVKEYSRSSADQEEPLPLELRPLPVLFDTMVFLLREVADLGGEGKWSEWYDFLWNRTRGIRKDITQQQLCSLEVAELLEKCTRFHIFCSERLCEEGMMSFDDKINNENLTKCLQTLKELYADLETKQGVFCPNEAEFRAYMVLMKLNEGDTLREVQQLRPQIRESGPIKFAIEAHTALNSNNYVRFFRLIQEASFLNACILHRYFNQIRNKALRIIKKAYRGTNSKFPVQEMIRLLKFETADQVKQFCSHYLVEVDENDVILDSRSFVEPETSIPHLRSPSLIESKQTVSVGETIYGGPFPASQLAPPVSSFDEEGAFIFSREFEQALVQFGLTLKPSSQSGNLFSAAQKPSAPASPAKFAYSFEAIRTVARTLILTETDAETINIAKEVVQEEKERLSVIALCINDLISSCIDEDMKTIADETIAHEEAVLRKTIEENRKKQREHAMESLSTQILREVEKEIGLQIAQEEMSLVQEELHKQRKDRCAHACAGDLLDTVVNELIEDTSTDFYQIEVVARREQLEETEKIVQLMRTCRWFKIWRDNHLRRVRVRRAMLDFPAAPPALSLPDQVSALVPIRPSERIKRSAFFIGERAKLNVQSPMDAFRQDFHLSAHLSMASAQQMLFNIRMWQPIDLVYCVGNQILRAVQQWNVFDNDVIDSFSIQWKLIVSLPKQKFDDSDKEQKFIHWMKAKLSHQTGKRAQENSPPYEGEILSQCTTELPLRGTKPLHKSIDPTLSFCLRCFHGIWNDSQLPEIKKKCLLKGSSGFLFVTNTAERLTEQKALWTKECQRLHQLFTEKTRDPSLPLVVVIPRATGRCVIDLDSVKTYLKLDNLHKDGLLMTVHIAQPLVNTGDVFVDVNAEWDTQLTSCLRFLATHLPSPPCVRVKNVSDYVEDAVVEYYKAPVYQDLRTRNRHQMLHQSPNVLISLYNDIIEHVAMVTSDDSLTQFSWPAPEFDNPKSAFNSDWNSMGHLADVYELITKLRLPTFRYSDKEKDDWPTLCQDIWNYINILTKKDSGSAKICLFQQITELLQSTKKQFDQFCWLASEDGPCEPSYVNMAWTDFLDACIHYRLVSLRTGHLCIESMPEEDETEVEDKEVKELLVYFHEDELADWEAPLSWEEALRDTESLEQGQLKASVQRAVSRRMESMMNPISTISTSLDNQVSQSEDDTTTAAKTIVAEPEIVEPDAWTQLRAQLKREREETERLESVLASSLKIHRLSSLGDGLNTPSSKSCLRGFGDVSVSLKRRRIPSDELDEVPAGSSLLVTPRPDLPRAHFEKLRKLENSADEVGEGETIIKENSFEKKVTEVLTSPSLSTRLANLKRDLEEERRADKLFEMKMSNLLNSNIF